MDLAACGSFAGGTSGRGLGALWPPAAKPADSGAADAGDYRRHWRRYPTPWNFCDRIKRKNRPPVDKGKNPCYNEHHVKGLNPVIFSADQNRRRRGKLEGLTRLRQPLWRIGNQPQLQPSPGHPSQLSGENCLAGKGIRLNISQGSSVQQPPDSQHSFTGME